MRRRGLDGGWGLCTACAMRLLDDLFASRRALAGFVVIGLGWAAFWAQMPVIKAQVGVSDSLWGTLALLGSAGGLTSMWLAPVVERAAGRWSMVLGIAVMLSGLVAAGLAQGPLALGLSLCAVSAGAGIADVFSNAEVSEAEAETGRSLMNLNHGMFSVGYAVSAIAVGAARAGGLGPVTIFVAIAGLVVLVTPWMLVRHRVDEDDMQDSTGMPRAIVWVGGLIVLSAFLGEAAIEGWSALHIERTLGAGPAEGAMGPALLGIGMAVGRLGAHLAGARWPAMRVMMLASCMAGIGLALAALAPGVTTAYVGFLLGGLGVSVVGPLALGLVGQAVRPKYRLVAISQSIALGHAAFLLGPVLMGFVSDGFGLHMSFYVVAAILLGVAALLVPTWARMLSRR